MKSTLSFLIICFGLIISVNAQELKKCIINGEVINRPESTHLLFLKAFDSPRTTTPIKIPIKNNTFSFEFNYDDVEAYTLIFEDEINNGLWIPIFFFPTNGSIQMKLHPMDNAYKNVVVGGDENEYYFDFIKNRKEEGRERTKLVREKLYKLEKEDAIYTQETKNLFNLIEDDSIKIDRRELYEKIDELHQSKEAYTDEAKKLILKKDSINKALLIKELNYIENNLSIPNYYFLTDHIKYFKDRPAFDMPQKLKNIQEKYSLQYPNHPYTDYSSKILWSYFNIITNGKYYDFTLPDVNGKEHKLSHLIQGKPAFLTIWAPWCAPCVKKNHEVASIYDQFKDKNFTVVSVVTNYEKLEYAENRIQKDHFPWVTLIDKPELKSNIAYYYNIDNAGGISLLLDETGKILLINPDIKEIEKFLSKK